MIALFAIHLLLALPGDDPSPAAMSGPVQNDSILVRYDLSSAILELDEGAEWSQSLAPDMASRWGDIAWVDYQSGLHAPVPPEVVKDVISRVLGDELLERGRQATLEGEATLVVVAPAGVQEKVAKILSTLQRALSARDTFRLDLLSNRLDGAAGRPLEGGILTPQEADERISDLASRGTDYRSITLRLVPGRTTALDQGTEHRILLDYDIEIAQASVVYDPYIASYRDGWTLLAHGVRRGAATACTLLLRGSTPLSTVGERPISMQVGIGSDKLGSFEFHPGPRTVQTVDLLGRSAAFTTLVPDDRVVAFSSSYETGGTSYVQTGFLRRESGNSTPFYRASFGTTTLMLVNSEIFSGPGFGFTAGRSEPGYGDHPLLQADYAPGQASFLFDWLKYRFSIWRRLGPWAVIVTDPAWDNQALPALEALLASLQDDDRVVQWTATLAGADGNRFASWSLPVLVGTEVGATVGKTTPALVDYDVEVAQFACGPDPVVAPLFDGLVFRARLLPGEPLRADFEAWGRHLALPIERPRMDPSPDASPFELLVDRYRMDRVYADERIDLAAGSGVHLGGEPKGSGRRTGLTLTVRTQ